MELLLGYIPVKPRFSTAVASDETSATFTAIAKGIYKVYASRSSSDSALEYTGVDIEVSSTGANEATIDYYTIEIDSRSNAACNGAGTYLKGVKAEIKAYEALAAVGGYKETGFWHFYAWEAIKGTAPDYEVDTSDPDLTIITSEVTITEETKLWPIANYLVLQPINTTTADFGTTCGDHNTKEGAPDHKAYMVGTGNGYSTGWEKVQRSVDGEILFLFPPIYLCVPDYYNGKPVIAIAEEAFHSYDANIFLQDKVKAVKLGKNMQIIGNRAFCYLAGGLDIEIPGSVKAIGDGAFAGTDISSIRFLENTNEPGLVMWDEAFGGGGIESLTTLVIDRALVSGIANKEELRGKNPDGREYYLFDHIETIYVKNGITVGAFIKNNYNQVDSEKTGYLKYVKKTSVSSVDVAYVIQQANAVEAELPISNKEGIVLELPKRKSWGDDADA